MDDQATRNGLSSDERNGRSRDEKRAIERREKWMIEQREMDAYIDVTKHSSNLRSSNNLNIRKVTTVARTNKQKFHHMQRLCGACSGSPQLHIAMCACIAHISSPSKLPMYACSICNNTQHKTTATGRAIVDGEEAIIINKERVNYGKSTLPFVKNGHGGMAYYTVY